MSYDVMVFEDAKAPRTKEEFVEWYEKQVAWSEGHDYSDISIAAPSLQNFYEALKKSYIFADDLGEDGNYNGEEGGKYIDHAAIGREIIYMCFPRGNAAEIYEDIMDMAMDNGVGIVDVEGGSEVIFANGEYIYDPFY